MSVTMELILTRHGQASCNVAGVVGGPKTCSGLTDLGRRQIEALAVRLHSEYAQRAVAAVYAGPRMRLRQSGQIIADSLQLSPVIEPGLDGPSPGAADGRPWHEIKTAFRGPPDSSPDHPWAAGSETWNEYLRRATTFLATLLERHHGDRIVLAAHGETVIAAHVLLLHLPSDVRVSFVTDHASLTLWQRHRNRFGDQRWLLAAHNDTAHLNAISDEPSSRPDPDQVHLPHPYRGRTGP